MFDDDSGGFGGPLFMLQAMAPMMIMITVLTTMMSFGLVLYLVARWRDHRAPAPDPQLGLKYVLHFFRFFSYVMLLGGTNLLVFSMLGKDLGEARELIYRPAFGLIVPAGIVFGITSVLLGKTNNYAYPAVGRLFSGFSLIAVGTAGFFAFVSGFVLLFQKGSTGQPGRIVWSMILVYTTAAAIQGAIFGRQVLEGPPPPPYAPPSPPAGDPLPEPMQKPLA